MFCLYKDPALVDDYKTIANGTDILTNDGIFYYGLAQRMWGAGYRVFDNISFYEYLSGKDDIRNEFETRGGYKTVQDITSLLSVDNADTYYDELVKNNLLLHLYTGGFDVLSILPKLNEMTSEEVYSYFDYKLNDICVNKVEKTMVENLSTGYDAYIREADKGAGIGYRIGYPMLNYRLAGVHKDNLLLHLAHIGNGKTTTSILFYVLPVIEAGDNVCIISTEQVCNEFRSMILASVLTNKVGYYGMNRQKLTTGHFTDEQKQKLKQASDWLEQCPGKISFVELHDYDARKIKKVVRRNASLGVGLFIVDTLKPEQENSDRAWADFSNLARELFEIAKQAHVAVVATAQLSADSMQRRYLDLSCVGKSRAIAETATQVVMFRTIRDDEKPNLKIYKYSRSNPDDPESKKVKQFLTPDVNNEWLALFTPKNRFGSTTPQLIYERNMGFNTLRELGYCDIPYDGYSARR